MLTSWLGLKQNGFAAFPSSCSPVTELPVCVSMCALARVVGSLAACYRRVRLLRRRPSAGPPFYSHTRSRKLFSETRQKLHLIKRWKCLGTWASVTELIGKTYRSLAPPLPHPPTPGSPSLILHSSSLVGYATVAVWTVSWFIFNFRSDLKKLTETFWIKVVTECFVQSRTQSWTLTACAIFIVIS